MSERPIPMIEQELGTVTYSDGVTEEFNPALPMPYPVKIEYKRTIEYEPRALSEETQ